MRRTCIVAGPTDATESSLTTKLLDTLPGRIPVRVEITPASTIARQMEAAGLTIDHDSVSTFLRQIRRRASGGDFIQRRVERRSCLRDIVIVIDAERTPADVQYLISTGSATLVLKISAQLAVAFQYLPPHPPTCPNSQAGCIECQPLTFTLEDGPVWALPVPDNLDIAAIIGYGNRPTQHLERITTLAMATNTLE